MVSVVMVLMDTQGILYDVYHICMYIHAFAYAIIETEDPLIIRSGGKFPVGSY